MPSWRMHELQEVCWEWGLRVEGNESYDELFTAYKYLKAYRQSRDLPTVFQGSVDYSHSARSTRKRVARTSQAS